MHEEGACSEEVRDLDWVGYAALIFNGEISLERHFEIQDLISAFMACHTKAELMKGAFERRVLVVPLSDASDLAESAQLAAREYWIDVEHADRAEPVRYAGPFVKLSKTPIRYASSPPLLDETGAPGWRTRSTMAALRSDPPAGGLPLEGLKVLDFSWVYAGPAITRYLADYGATVVRVESLTAFDALRNGTPFKDGIAGAERSANYGNVNLNKLSLGLNLRTPEARDVARQLVGWADVVVENYTPRMMKQWELDYPRLREINPALVMLSSCLSGQDGPDASLAGYGTMGAALAGFGFLTGWPDRPPSAPFVAYTDYVSPKLATSALLAALDHRRRTGEGQHIDCSQSESAMHLLGEALLEVQVNGNVRRAAGNASAHWAPSGVYPVIGEDRWLAIAAADDASWRALSDLAGRGWASDARFISNDDRLANRDSLDEAIAQWTVDLNPEALEAALQAAGVPAHRVATSADCFADPQLAHRDHFVELEHAVVGRVPWEHSRFILSRTPAPVPRVVPTLGQDNQVVLGDILGLDDAAITELVIAGAIE
jgi:crotonobetainyl-CoA:carnitine CoA-transferase CaiB-like acyl-CoA transferase